MPRTGLSAAEIKQKAIAATMVRMREDGFDKVKLTDIAKQLGVSHAALYAHFEDKAALLDAVSAHWLLEVDATLDAVCKKAGDPSEKITAWMLAFHRAKVAKIVRDPEPYKSFDLHASMAKPYVRNHIATVRTQLVGLVTDAIAKRRLKHADAAAMAEVIWEAMMAFHHPKLVAAHITEKREPLLRMVLESVLRGLGLA
jgi:AcrR family transcriptional regulator